MEALYRKYRPTTFSDVVGQEHIERTLKNAIEQNKVSHAYLFCGPRGTGKTTMARILAKALLCEKAPTVEPDGTCSECEAIAHGTHPDVYELDAASRTGVDNVREEIISRVNYAPTRGAWKVYIIDEVHMLSNAAFNALLKTLEEPPGHVVFILCTTDPQEVPETIHSRCQRFDFHRISNEAIVSRLGAICVKEDVDFEGEALDLIAYRAEGGMRNALTSLEQLIAFGDGHVTLEGAQNLLGSLDETDLSEIMLSIGRRDAASCFNWVARYVETGADLAQFVQDLSEYVHDMYLLSMAGLEVEIRVSEATRKAMVDQLKHFGSDRLSRLLMILGDLQKELRFSSNPRLSFEIALTRMVRPESDLTLEALAERIEQLERKMASDVAMSLDRGAPAIIASTPLVTSDAEPRFSDEGCSRIDSVPSASMAYSATTAPVVSTDTLSSIPASTPSAVPSKISTAVSMPSGSEGEPSSVVSSASAASISAEAMITAFSSAAGASSVLIDMANPAAVQRFWHSVTTSLRKANPARGVLFMNAKISAEADSSGLIVTFAKDNGFAYTAAQKPEVQKLLAQTIESVAGGQVPYRLVLEGEDQGVFSGSQAISPQVSLRSAGVSGGALETHSSNEHASADASASPIDTDRVHAAVEAAKAAARAVRENSDAVQVQANARNQHDRELLASHPSKSSSSASAPSQDLVPDEDQVPLEAYEGAYYPAEEQGTEGADGFGSVQETKAPSSSVAPREQEKEVVNDEEPDRIKSILLNSFGEGIAFEELSD